MSLPTKWSLLWDKHQFICTLVPSVLTFALTEREHGIQMSVICCDSPYSLYRTAINACICSNVSWTQENALCSLPVALVTWSFYGTDRCSWTSNWTIYLRLIHTLSDLVYCFYLLWRSRRDGSTLLALLFVITRWTYSATFAAITAEIDHLDGYNNSCVDWLLWCRLLSSHSFISFVHSFIRC